MIPLLDVFQSFRTIFCVCPCCGSIVRISDLRLRYKGVVHRTWIDEYDLKLKILEEKETRFEEKEKERRNEAVERGRRKVPRIIRKSLYTEFAKLPYDPYDIKAILHPVDFVIFNGLSKGANLKDIVFLSKRTPNVALNRVRNSISNTIIKERYDLKIARVSLDGKVEFE